MKLLRLLALLCLASSASAQTYYNKTTIPPLPPQSPILYAASYGSCTWDATHDVGACINSAIAKAAANGGGTVMIPASPAGSFYGVSTQILNTTAGVKLQGAGLGIPRDSLTNSKFLGTTVLKWIGGSTAAPMILVQTPNGATSTLYSADVTGIVADCNAGTAGIGIEINGVSFSTFKVAAAECSSINILFAVPTYLEGLGNQYNDIWAYSRSTSSASCATGCPTGIMFDSSAGATFNTSYNRMWDLYAWYNKGDGIVFGDDDNNTVMMVETATQTPGTSTGQPIVCANGSYTSPNGVAVSGNCRSLRVLHYGGRGFAIQGSQSGSVLAATGGNAGTAALNNGSFTVSTNAAQGATQLLTSATGTINANESVNCGGLANGFISNNPISQIVANASVSFIGSFAYTVPSSTVCTLTYGFTSQAPKGPGTYTITATSSTQYSIAYSGTGSAHAQSGITASGGFLIFTDIVLPWTGTPTTNDSWTVTLPLSTRWVDISGQDKGNNAPTPTFEYGSSGTWWPQGQALPWAWNEACNYYNAGNASGNNAQIDNVVSGQTCVLGGSSNVASGNFGVIVGGTNNAITANAAAAVGGQNNSLTGTYSAAVGGFYTSDRGRYGSTCYASGRFAATGDAQTCFTVLRGTGASTSAVRLTGDGAAASTDNCVNIPNNTAYGLTINILAFDHTTTSKNEAWNVWTGLLTRGANAASTAVSLNTTPTPLTNGTVTGSAIAVTADTTNGCLNISFTPPSANADTWNVVAKVETAVEAQ